MVGKPQDVVSYDKSLDRMTQLFIDKREEMKFICNACKLKDPSKYCKKCKNKRRDFCTLSFGVSYTGRQTIGKVPDSNVPC